MSFNDFMKLVNFPCSRRDIMKMKLAWAKSAEAHKPRWIPIDDNAKKMNLVILKNSKSNFVTIAMHYKLISEESLWAGQGINYLESDFDYYMEIPG